LCFAVIVAIAAGIVAPACATGIPQAIFQTQGTEWVNSNNNDFYNGSYLLQYGYSVSIQNMPDTSDTILGNISYGINADNIIDYDTKEYAMKNGPTITWTFPDNFTLAENEYVLSGVKSGYGYTRNIPITIHRWVNRSVFSADGDQLASFSVMFDNLSLDGANMPYDNISVWGEFLTSDNSVVNATMAPDSFTSTMPLLDNPMAQKDLHFIEFSDPNPIAVNTVYNFSVILHVHLKKENGTAITYYPKIAIALGGGDSFYDANLSTTADTPSFMLPAYVHYAGGSTNISNEWYYSSEFMQGVQLNETDTVSNSAQAPIITSISPASGSIAGGTVITISGTGFTGATAVKFGSTAATSVKVTSVTTITATAPAHVAGTVDVTVTTSGGTSATSAADQYTYEVPPAVTKVNLNTGPLGGGTPVSITGTNLLGATNVYFGGIPATSYTVNNATSITTTTPGNGAGTVDVTVTTPGGTSATSAADQYTYEVPPAVTKVNLNTGPLGGGTPVSITGTNLLGATKVYFGGTPATSYTVNSATSITATSPAAQSGSIVVITVITPSGTSAIVPADQFTYTGNTQSSIAVMRSMPATVAPGASIIVTLTPGTTFVTSPGWGVMETLPAGWTFVSTTADSWSAVGGSYQFAELSATPITYTVTAPATRGAYTFNGTYIDGNKDTGTVVGAVSVTVVPDPLQTYDTNHDGYIEKSEAIAALTDYLFNGTLSKADCVTVITAYLFHTPVT
jgi:hypothetical protein